MQSAVAQGLWRATSLLAYALGLLLYAYAWFPLALWSSWAVAAAHIRLARGMWPRYGMPAFKYAGPTGLEDAAFFMCLAAFVAISGVVAHRAVRPRFTWVVLTPLAFCVGWGLFFLLLYLDPAGILEWAMF
jgi:hypothetical protein